MLVYRYSGLRMSHVICHRDGYWYIEEKVAGGTGEEHIRTDVKH